MAEWVRRHGLPLRWPADQVDLRWTPTIPDAGHSHSSSEHRLGLTKVCWTEQVRLGRASRKYEVSVFLKKNLPEFVFRGVATHELGHLWMMTEDINDLAPDECEGVCELLAFLYYKSLGSKEGDRHAQRIANNPDPIYGGGFRKVFSIYERLGLATICRTLATSRSLKPLINR